MLASTSDATTTALNSTEGVTGVITQYDATQKALTIRPSNNATCTFAIGQARIEKSQSITTQNLETLLANDTSIVSFTGERSGNTTYTAQEVTVVDVSVPDGQNGNVPGGNPPPASGKPPADDGAPGNGAPPSGTPPNGVVLGGTPLPNNGHGPAGGNQGIVLQHAKMQNNQLVATTFSGQTVTVTLETSTKIVQQSAGTASDLKTGLQVTVTQAPMTQNSSAATASASLIVITTA